jgi:hypothetical protein
MTVTAAGIAVVVIGLLLFRGETGRLGMVALVIMGTALSIAGDLRGVVFEVAGALTSVANTLGGAL